jgi:hypothetical protein
MVVLALGVPVALTASAGAGEVERVETKVTIKDRCLEFNGTEPAFECRTAARQRNYDARFSGRVKSDEAKCERGRKVKVILVEPHVPDRGDETGPIGTTRSDENGRWVFTEDKPGFGKYRAKATKKRKGDVICKADKSKRIDHDPPKF